MGLNKPTDNLGATDEEVVDSLREDVIAAFKICNQQRERISTLERELGALKSDRTLVVTTPFPFLHSDFLTLMNDIGRLGREKYGDDIATFTARKPGERWESTVVVEHVREHLDAYLRGVPHDHFGTFAHQLAAAAFNCMFEFIFSQGE